MSRYGFGVDVGGTSCKIGLFNEGGELLDKWEIPTNTANCGEAILTDIAASIENKKQEKNISTHEVIGIGIGVPGPVRGDGIVNGCVNLGWGRRNVAQELQELSRVSVKVANDANVAALGEFFYGCGKGQKSLIMITLGTGVGGGVIIDGQILHGATGAGGEIGHMTVNPEERDKCNCGRRGCLEQYVSATGIRKMARKVLTKNEENTILNIDTVDAKEVFDAAKNGDRMALEIVENVSRMLGMALNNLAVVVNPSMFVIGGGVSKAGDIIPDMVSRYFKESAFHACKDTPVVLATLGNDAGIFGCMGMLMHQ